MVVEGLAGEEFVEAMEDTTTTTNTFHPLNTCFSQLSGHSTCHRSDIQDGRGGGEGGGGEEEEGGGGEEEGGGEEGEKVGRQYLLSPLKEKRNNDSAPFLFLTRFIGCCSLMSVPFLFIVGAGGVTL